jgi:hypothetical protein
MNNRAPRQTRVVAPGDLLGELESRLATPITPRGRARRPRKPLLAGLGVVSLMVIMVSSVLATTVLDLTTANSSVTLANGAVYTQGLPVPVSGTGVLDPFLRIQNAKNVEAGISTDTNNVLDETNSWTKALLLSNVPVIRQNGVNYREFLLDINQVASTPLLSLDEVKLFLTSTPAINSYVDAGLTGGGTINGTLYSAGSGIGHMVFSQGDNIVKLNYVLESGSGKPDMTLLIPDSVFGTPGVGDYCGYAQAGCNTWMGFYSRFGGWNGTNISGTNSLWPNNDGFEEWSTIIRPVVNVTKTATATASTSCTWTIEKSVDQTEITIASGTATFNYTVAVNHNCTSGTPTVTGNITITNPLTLPDGTKTLDATIASVTDVFTPGDISGTVTCSGGFPFTLTSGQTKVCTYTLLPGSATDGTNTATVTLTDTSVAPVTATAPVTFTNALTDTSITVVDDKTDPANPVTLGTADYTQANPITFTYSLSKPGVAGTCTDYTNTATFTTNTTQTTGSDSQTVTVCVGKDLTVSKDATPAFTRTYTWDITKDVDKTKVTVADGSTATFNYTVSVTHDSGTDSGWTLTGTITVNNPNDFEDIVATVTDAVDNGGTCSVTGGVSATIPKSGSKTFAYSCTYASAPSPLSGTNTATATWDKAVYLTPNGTASGTASANFSGAPTTIVDGSITVVDDKTNPASPVTLGTASYTQANPITFTYSLTKPGVAGTCTDYTNIATFTTNTTATTGSDTQTVTVCVGLDLTVSKDSAPTFTRTYKWDITKDVDQTSVTINNGDSATFNYTVTVSHDSGTDSLWKLTGTITVTNPNDFEAITFDLADAVDNGGTCSIDGGGTGLSVAASSSVTATYTCTYASAPSPLSGTNTATATWDKAAAHTPTGSASGTASADFSGAPTSVVDESISVDDTFAGHLGDVSVGDPNPSTFTYSRTVTPADYGGVCATTTYDNTASFVTNDTKTTGSDSQTVSVIVINCGVPGKTPGFWGNRNGHAILDVAGDGTLDTPVTIGSGSHTFTVTTIAQSDKILHNSDCVAGAPVIFVCTGANGLVAGLNTNTFEELGAQTLALTYNINNITGFSGQTVGALGCESFITAPLSSLGLSSSSTVNQVLTVANTLIGQSFKPGGTATQAQEGAMNSLLSCLNRETL